MLFRSLDYVGFEIDADYFKTANKRLEEERAQIRLFDLLERQERAAQRTLFDDRREDLQE